MEEKDTSPDDSILNASSTRTSIQRFVGHLNVEADDSGDVVECTLQMAAKRERSLISLIEREKSMSNVWYPQNQEKNGLHLGPFSLAIYSRIVNTMFHP